MEFRANYDFCFCDFNPLKKTSANIDVAVERWWWRIGRSQKRRRIGYPR
jgi:hypothetical protein